MSFYEKQEWDHSSRIRGLQAPTFVRESGLQRQGHSVATELSTVATTDWYEGFIARSDVQIGGSGSSAAQASSSSSRQPRLPPSNAARTSEPALSQATSVAVPALSKPRSKAPPRKNKVSRTSDPHWFIARAVGSSSDQPLPFSLAAASSSASSTTTPSSSSTSSTTSMASLLTLPDPGTGPTFVPPPHFHLQPGSRGWKMLEKSGWTGRGLGKDENVISVAPALAAGRKGKERERDGQTALDEKPIKRAKRPLKMDGDVVDLTESTDDESTSSSSSSDDQSPSPPPPPVVAPPTSSAHPSRPASLNSRVTLIAPLATTLKSDLRGIRPASETAAHRAVTHSAEQIRAARRAVEREAQRLSAKEIGRRAKKDSQDRVALIASLKWDD